jgi:hypothetical protein
VGQRGDCKFQIQDSRMGKAGGGCKLVTMEKVQIHHQGFVGMLWIAAWLFTIGFLHLPFWKGVFALVLWPYYLGLAFAK